MTVGRHADERRPRPRGRTMARLCGDRVVGRRRSRSTTSAAAGQLVAVGHASRSRRRTRRGSSSGSHTGVGAELAGQAASGGGSVAAAMIVPARRRGGARAAIVSRPSVPAPSTTTVSPSRIGWRERGVDGAGGRLDHHGGLVAHVVGHGVELAGVGDHRRAPAAAGVAAEAGLQPGLEVAEGQPLAVAEVAAGAGRAGRVDAAGHAAEHRLQHDAAVVVGVGHDLVAGDEREADDRLEVAAGACRRWSTGRCRRCRPAGAGRGPSPGRAGRAGRRRSSSSGPTWPPAPGATGAGDAGGGEAGRACGRSAAPSSRASVADTVDGARAR